MWRDGQRKRVFVYRFLSTGSIEEKVFQRQMSKEGLKQLVGKTGEWLAARMRRGSARACVCARICVNVWIDSVASGGQEWS